MFVLVVGREKEREKENEDQVSRSTGVKELKNCHKLARHHMAELMRRLFFIFSLVIWFSSISMRRCGLKFLVTTIALTTTSILIIISTANSKSKRHDRENILVNCDCPQLKNDQHFLTPTNATEFKTTNQGNSCREPDRNSSIQRAIIIYYPSHQNDYFFPEVRWWVEFCYDEY